MLTTGTRVGVYEITALIGEGGMGQVYRACGRRVGGDVAIKILPAANHPNRRRKSGVTNRALMRGRPRPAALSLLLLLLAVEPARAQDVLSLFDNSSLQGWREEHTEASVQNRALAVRGGPGWVRTNDVFADFVLTLDVRLLGDNAKAAVFVRAWPTFDRNTLAPTNGSQVTIANRERADSAAEAVGWRRLEIRCVGRNLQVSLDGVMVLAEDSLNNPQGHVAFAAQTGGAEFRAIELRKIKPPELQARAGIFLPGQDVALPRLRREVKPRYTADALSARIQGKVLLTAIVLPDGTVGETEVVQSLDPTFGLDREAVRALRQWQFVPGTRNGQPVPVLVSVQLSFTLR